MLLKDRTILLKSMEENNLSPFASLCEAVNIMSELDSSLTIVSRDVKMSFDIADDLEINDSDKFVIAGQRHANIVPFIKSATDLKMNYVLGPDKLLYQKHLSVLHPEHLKENTDKPYEFRK